NLVEVSNIVQYHKDNATQYQTHKLNRGTPETIREPATGIRTDYGTQSEKSSGIACFPDTEVPFLREVQRKKCNDQAPAPVYQAD
ncbi:MAG: hypothetical protein RLZ62_2388, partial [Bacteroidota bacterium]